MILICCNIHSKSWRNKKYPQRLTKIKALLNKYNWEGINYPPENDDWRKFEKNDLTIAFNVFYAKNMPWLCFKT